MQCIVGRLFCAKRNAVSFIKDFILINIIRTLSELHWAAWIIIKQEIVTY
jgi:hypothetical protein